MIIMYEMSGLFLVLMIVWIPFWLHQEKRKRKAEVKEQQRKSALIKKDLDAFYAMKNGEITCKEYLRIFEDIQKQI
jgi:uncharacterized membrane protein